MSGAGTVSHAEVFTAAYDGATGHYWVRTAVGDVALAKFLLDAELSRAQVKSLGTSTETSTGATTTLIHVFVYARGDGPVARYFTRRPSENGKKKEDEGNE